MAERLSVDGHDVVVQRQRTAEMRGRTPADVGDGESAYVYLQESCSDACLDAIRHWLPTA
eukprot:269440-Hanusia_phi.AAC.3